MPATVGVSLDSKFVRATYRQNGRLVCVEHEWDSLAPNRVVDALRAEIGSATTIVLAVGLGFLEVAKPELPAMTNADRRRVLLRDADRYFPLEGKLAISSGAASALAFAMHAEVLERWSRAFAEWAPVRAVVAAPHAIATVAPNSGSFLVEAGADEQGLLQIASGEVREARRIPLKAVGSIPKGATPLTGGYTDASPGRFSAAAGALNFASAPLDAMLLDASLEESLRVARTRRRWLSYALAATALAAIGLAANARRDATLRATQHAVDSLQAVAAPALAANLRLEQLKQEANLLTRRTAQTADPLHVLATLGDALPKDAFVQRLEWDGKEWRLDGSVNQAASIVPRLDSARVFGNVRVLGASTRFRDGGRMRESFSVAFQLKGDSVVGR